MAGLGLPVSFQRFEYGFPNAPKDKRFSGVNVVSFLFNFFVNWLSTSSDKLIGHWIGALDFLTAISILTQKSNFPAIRKIYIVHEGSQLSSADSLLTGGCLAWETLGNS